MHPRLLGVLVSALVFAPSASAQSLSIEALDARGFQVNGWPYRNPTISADGRWIAYESFKDFLPGDFDDHIDILLRDRLTGSVRIVSVSSSGDGGGLNALSPSMSADGRFIAFQGLSPDLTPGDANGQHDIFLHDAWQATTTLISSTPSGVSGDGASTSPRISADGQWIVFTSEASNLVAGDVNGVADVFVRNVASGVTQLVSVSSSGALADAACTEPAISADARFVVFTSSATTLTPGANNLARIYLRDLELGVTEIVSLNNAGLSANLGSMRPRISADGRFVTFTSFATNLDPNDTDNSSDVFLRDRAASTTELVSRTSQAAQSFSMFSYGPSDVSADGRYVVFVSLASDLGIPLGGSPDRLYVYDRLASTTIPASLSTSGLIASSITASALTPDGRYLVFSNFGLAARDLTVIGHPDVDVYCAGNTHSGGCAGQIYAGGFPSAAGPASLFVSATQMKPQVSGLFFWGFQPASTPFHGGTLCVGPPLRRTPVQPSGGSLATFETCSGTYAFHVSPSFIALNNLGAGDTLYGQFYQRDTAAGVDAYALTSAMSFTIAP